MKHIPCRGPTGEFPRGTTGAASKGEDLGIQPLRFSKEARCVVVFLGAAAYWHRNAQFEQQRLRWGRAFNVFHHDARGFACTPNIEQQSNDCSVEMTL